jgi:hypothetical protein
VIYIFHAALLGSNTQSRRQSANEEPAEMAADLGNGHLSESTHTFGVVFLKLALEAPALILYLLEMSHPGVLPGHRQMVLVPHKLREPSFYFGIELDDLSTLALCALFAARSQHLFVGYTAK